MKDCPACAHQNLDDAKLCDSCGYEFDSDLSWDKTKVSEGRVSGFGAGDLIAGRYLVVRELGRGGMGVVYLVQDTELGDQEVALKMIHPQLVAHPEAQKRFAQDVLVSQKLAHPNIVRVHDLKRSNGLRFFTMEYIQGQSLRSLLNERKKINGPPFSFSEVMAIMTPLLDALSYAHQYTVHRDIKPENIMVLGEFPDIAIKVLDFGIAKTLSPSRFSQKAQALGTAYYMAPEQMAGGADVDHRADLYSVGMVFYEMLMGQVAVGIPDLPTRIYPELPEDIDGVIIRILKPFAKDRYGSADEVKKALQEIASLPVTADKETPSAAAQRGEKGKDKSKEKPASGPKKSRALPIVLGLICLLVVGGLVYWWLPGKKGPGLPEIVSQTAVLQKESSPKMEAPEVPSNSLAKGRAMLQVTSVAEGATVFLAGRRLGQTPYTGEGLSEGELPLRLEHKYYSVREEKIVLSADQVTKCN